VVLPVFLLLVMGIVEFGRMIMIQQVLTNASREGARRAALAGATANDVQGVVDAFLSTASVSGATVSVTPNSLTSAAPGSQVSVSVSIPFSQVSWMPPWFSSGVTLSANSLMRREGIP
jgi:Flp pilus assembly protein TadG